MEVNVVVSGLADDHRAVKDMLLELVEEHIPGARTIEPAHLPGSGFLLVLAVPIETVSGAGLHQLQRALARELDRRGVLYDHLQIEVE